MKPTERLLVDERGHVTSEKSVELDSMFDAIRGFREMHKLPSTKAPVGSTYLGSIDMITAAKWAKECGCGIGTKGFAVHAKKKLMDSDYSKFTGK